MWKKSNIERKIDTIDVEEQGDLISMVLAFVALGFIVSRVFL
jgi:hypothetical protein